MAVERLYAWIRTAFGNREFTLWDFRATFPSPNPTKIISDLARRGYLERVARGVYRAIPPGHRLRALAADEEKSFGLAGTSTLPHAYSRETAIAIWTDGGYWTGFTAGFRPLHLDIDRRHVNRWKAFFRQHGARAEKEGERVTLYGIVHILHPVRTVRAVDHGGVRVIPRKEALAYAQARPYAFEPVIPILQRSD